MRFGTNVFVQAVIFMVAFVSADAVQAQSHTPPTMSATDRAMLRAYMPTEDKMERFAKVATELAAAETADPSLKAEDTAAANGPTFAALLKNLKAHPRLQGYYHRHGIADLDVVVFPYVVLSSKMVVAVPQVAYMQPVTPAQVSFYRRHQQALDTIFLSAGN